MGDEMRDVRAENALAMHILHEHPPLQAGGTKPEKLDAALKKAYEVIEKI